MSFYFVLTIYCRQYGSEGLKKNKEKGGFKREKSANNSYNVTHSCTNLAQIRECSK